MKVNKLGIPIYNASDYYKLGNFIYNSHKKEYYNTFVSYYTRRIILNGSISRFGIDIIKNYK
jgi:hypothetical protein